jgi:hypothetical protein
MMMMDTLLIKTLGEHVKNHKEIVGACVLSDTVTVLVREKCRKEKHEKSKEKGKVGESKIEEKETSKADRHGEDEKQSLKIREK